MNDKKIMAFNREIPVRSARHSKDSIRFVIGHGAFLWRPFCQLWSQRKARAINNDGEV
jgi:hypothetical protein